jgi:hypothetical protein
VFEDGTVSLMSVNGTVSVLLPHGVVGHGVSRLDNQLRTGNALVVAACWTRSSRREPLSGTGRNYIVADQLILRTSHVNFVWLQRTSVVITPQFTYP